ncbi:hypothetical protein DES42_11345 [Zavarzinia compransoris]|nr:hypothetical protein DES42_11345 [Zavarzinia compransoris]
MMPARLNRTVRQGPGGYCGTRPSPHIPFEPQQAASNTLQLGMKFDAIVWIFEVKTHAIVENEY